MLRVIFLLFLIVGSYFFSQYQIKGFRLADISTDIPNEARWETLAPGKDILGRLDQSFKYLGSGEQSHAFLGADGKTVLKFFIHRKQPKYHDPRPAFSSCKLAFEEIPKQTGLLYVHINKTKGLFPKVLIYDPSCVMHLVDLDSTEFMVQEYARPAIPAIAERLKAGDRLGAEKLIAALFERVVDYTHQGIHMDIPAIRRNFGFIGEEAILIDVGSFDKDPSYNTPEHLAIELKKVTGRLRRWLAKHQPELLPYYEKQFAKYK